MIQQLNVHNFVLLKDVTLDFSSGFNVLTGETGAGKSLLVDAMNFISGKRLTADIIGPHDDKTYVELFFSDIPDILISLLDEYGIDYSEGLIISREMNLKGKGNVRVNGRLIQVSQLKNIMSYLLDIHSQNETQFLLNDKYHLGFLDQYINSDSLLSLYKEEYQIYRRIQKDIHHLSNNELDPDMLEFSKQLLKELEAFNPSIDDYEEIRNKVKIMESLEKNKELLKEIKFYLKGDGKTLESLYNVVNILESSSIFESNLDTFKNLYFELEAASEELIDTFNLENFSEYEYNSLNERLIEYNKYIKKYVSVEGILQKIEELSIYINNIEQYDDKLQELESQLEKSTKTLQQHGHKLHEYRLKNKNKLENHISEILTGLQLENAIFSIDIQETEFINTGIDSISFLVSMNKGIPVAPLSKVASGGEISRFMLALKVAFSNTMQGMTLILDEIDTGVSGSVGMKIGQTMKELGSVLQVISITHLASVAACGESHFNIRKNEVDDVSITEVILLNEQERIEELAYIMSGMLNKSTIDTARNLLNEGQK